MKGKKNRLVSLIFILCFIVGNICSPRGVSGHAAAAEAAREPSQEGETALQDMSGPSAVRLTIDNQNRYEGMEKSYSEGYMPQVKDGGVYLVVPIQANAALQDCCMQVSLNLGDVQNTPFVVKNYERTVYAQQAAVNGGSQTVESYVADFYLDLKADRYNGSYPVTVNVRAADEAGNEIVQEFTVYVTITDGKMSKEEEAELPVFAPKVMVQSCQFSKNDILAGDKITAEITLINTSKTEPAKNMVVTAALPAEQFTLTGGSDAVYIDGIPAGKTAKVSYSYQVNAGAPQGQYDLELTMDYADSKGNTCSGSGKVKLSIKQPVQMKFDPLSLEAQVEVGDVVEASVQAMNLGRGRVYNVRAVIEADGLTPQGTLFIGDMEPGSVASASTQITVAGLSEGNSLYGQTEGTVTFYFEDESGQEQTEVITFQTKINSPFSEEKPQEDESGQWWIIVAIIGGLLVLFAVVVIVRKVRLRKQHEVVEKILET